MKKFALVLLAGISLATAAKAQKKEGLTFGVGVEAALPLGDFKTSHSFGIGGNVNAEYAFTENVTGIFTTGYTSYFGKTIKYDDGLGGTVDYKVPSVGHIPLLVGARYYTPVNFFVGAQVGYGIFTGGGGDAPKGFEYRPQVGFDFSGFQVALSYDGVSVTGGTLSHLGLTGIYTFGGSGK